MCSIVVQWTDGMGWPRFEYLGDYPIEHAAYVCEVWTVAYAVVRIQVFPWLE